MKEKIIDNVVEGMKAVLSAEQIGLLERVVRDALLTVDVVAKATDEERRVKENVELVRTASLSGHLCLPKRLRGARKRRCITIRPRLRRCWGRRKRA